ncbi:hypothetical protein RsTz2092_01140 [Deferribacterales bacterium RsTz2092]
MKKFSLSLISLLLFAVFAHAVTLDVTGEAQIKNGDTASAKIEAEARAKWMAIEKGSKVKVSVDTIVHDGEMLDESVKSAISATVTDFKITDEGTDKGVYWLTAKATVEPEKANAMLTKNMSIVVYLPLVKLGGQVEETHPFSEEVINELIASGFSVTDPVSLGDGNVAKQLLKAVQSNDMGTVRRLVSQYAAGSALIGKVEAVDKGKDIGYQKVNFTIVDGNLSYRVIGANASGAKAILKSGSMQGRGQGSNNDTAVVSLSNNMAKKNASILASEVATTVAGATKKSVQVVLVGNKDMVAFQEFRSVLQSTSWVTNIRETGADTLIVDYPEKTMYLATIISKNGGYHIRKFDDKQILVDPR